MRNANKDAIQKTKVAIIGAGFGGLAMAIRLLQSQINDFVILEKTNDVGGTGEKTNIQAQHVTFNRICIPFHLHLKLTGPSVTQKQMKSLLIFRILLSNTNLKITASLTMK